MSSSLFDVAAIRAQFPALAQEVAGRPAVFLDGPGGTQVPQSVIDAMADYLAQHNANRGGAFATSRHTDTILAEARAAVADLLHAASPTEIVFGPNMTTLTFNLSRALGREIGPGDEIVERMRANLAHPHGLDTKQWGYTHVPRRVFVEEVVTDGPELEDFQIMTFGTRVDRVKLWSRFAEPGI